MINSVWILYFVKLKIELIIKQSLYLHSLGKYIHYNTNFSNLICKTFFYLEVRQDFWFPQISEKFLVLGNVAQITIIVN